MSVHPTDSSWVKILPTETLDDPRLLRLHALWLSKCRGRAMPARADFDPLELKEDLGWIVLVDVERSPLRFRYRLIGTNIVDLAGRNVTGRYFDEIYEPHVERVATSSFRDILDTGTPNRVAATLQHAEKGFLTYEAIDLPLASDGSTVDMILIRSVFELR